MTKAQLIVDVALTQLALIDEDADELHLECSWGIGQPSSGLITVQHLLLGVKPLESRDRSEERHICRRQVEVDLSRLRACKLCKFFICDSLQKGLRDICREDVPTAAHSLAHDNLL